MNPAPHGTPYLQGPAPVTPPKKSKAPLLLGCAALGLIGVCCVGMSVLTFRSMGEASAMEPLIAACEGRPVAGAAVYDATRAVSAKVAVYERSRQGAAYLTSRHVPTNRRGTSVDDTALVVCLEEPRETELEACRYDSSTALQPGAEIVVRRVQHQRAARIVVAATGQVVKSEMLSGTQPSVCDDRERFIGGNRQENTRQGTTVGVMEVIRVLDALAAPPVDAPPGPPS